ncbi:EAL domain-containing protein, partial [Pseudomonas aeruginosa]|nr:EAL domain-containing protein [Pseudomonas aeruginosa]
ISEADATSYLKQAKQLTKGLATLHCQAAISQFGCSLNPFNALKHLTVQFIKIDGSFVQDLNQVENQEILKGLIAELHEQQKISIVPFVESAS